MSDIELVRRALGPGGSLPNHQRQREAARLAFERHLERDQEARRQLVYILGLLRDRKYERIAHIVIELIKEQE